MAEDGARRPRPPGTLSVARRSLEVQATERLREEIVGGRLRPGSRLTEQELALATGLSRGTVRGALAQLARDGLVRQIPYTGWTVRELGADDAWELYTLRSALEGLGARLAAARADPVASGRIEQAFADLLAACRKGVPATMAERDFALHAAIIGAASHDRLAEQYRNVEHQIRMHIISSDALITDPDELAAQHRPLVEAVLHGDPTAAEHEAVGHTTREGEKLVEHLRRVATAEVRQ